MYRRKGKQGIGELGAPAAAAAAAAPPPAGAKTRPHGAADLQKEAQAACISDAAKLAREHAVINVRPAASPACDMLLESSLTCSRTDGGWSVVEEAQYATTPSQQAQDEGFAACPALHACQIAMLSIRAMLVHTCGRCSGLQELPGRARSLDIVGYACRGVACVIVNARLAFDASRSRGSGQATASAEQDTGSDALTRTGPRRTTCCRVYPSIRWR